MSERTTIARSLQALGQSATAREHPRTVATLPPASKVHARATRPTAPTLDPRASARPTSHPELDVAALVPSMSLRRDSGTDIPFDLAVPVRTGVAPPIHCELREAFLLMHVDGHASLSDIARYCNVSLSETIGCFLMWLEQGVVAFVGASAGRRVPTSGLYCRPEIDVADDAPET